jgi:putative transposase
MDKPRNFYKDTFHHLYNRGANKEKIFLERKNYLLFLEKMKYYKDKYHIEIIAYCLMMNHFHLFVKQQTNMGNISSFISCLINSYTKSFNKSYQRTGTLFESKIKSKLVEDETYFKWIIKYILENPVKAGIVEHIEDYEYSNARDIFRLRNGNMTNVNETISYFQNEEQMNKFLLDNKIKVTYEF